MVCVQVKGLLGPYLVFLCSTVNGCMSRQSLKLGAVRPMPACPPGCCRACVPRWACSRPSGLQLAAAASYNASLDQRQRLHVHLWFTRCAWNVLSSCPEQQTACSCSCCSACTQGDLRLDLACSWQQCCMCCQVLHDVHLQGSVQLSAMPSSAAAIAKQCLLCCIWTGALPLHQLATPPAADGAPSPCAAQQALLDSGCEQLFKAPVTCREHQTA